MNLSKNSFINNFASLGGGVLYLNNKLLAESPYQSNNFSGNKASFANDFFTFPVRLQFTDNQTFWSWINKTTYSLNVVSGVSITSLYFYVVDYYGQIIQSMSGGLHFFQYSLLDNSIDILLCNLNHWTLTIYKTLIQK
jgi:hypothetical protein